MARTPANPVTKSHYEILDGLRGVAALMVVAFHTFEAYGNGNRFKQLINHGLGGSGDVIGGWAVDEKNLHIGIARVLYPFFAGVLLMRLGRRIHVKGAFPLCSLLLILIFSIPRIGGPTHLWMNGLYESFSIIVLFPMIVAMGAGDEITGRFSTEICKFFGGISYPLYITHYPLVYVYAAWAKRSQASANIGVAMGALLLLTSVAIAYACLKLYDEPVRAWLRRRVLLARAEKAAP